MVSAHTRQGLRMLKLAAYLDEASDDPAKACEILESEQIKHICLRRAWCRDIFSMQDSACSTLADTLKQHGLTPILLHTKAGDVPASELQSQIPIIKRSLMLCAYFKCQAMSISLGRTVKSDRVGDDITAWITTVGQLCLAANVLPVYEIDPACHVFDAAHVALTLSKFKRLRLIYDPGLIISQRKLDPFVKYWSLLKDSVMYIDIHDHKNGESPRLAGYGDAQLDLTISDAMATNFGGWYCLEPNLGRRLGTIQTRELVFQCALKAFRALMDKIEMRKAL